MIVALNVSIFNTTLDDHILYVQAHDIKSSGPVAAKFFEVYE